MKQNGKKCKNLDERGGEVNKKETKKEKMRKAERRIKEKKL